MRVKKIDISRLRYESFPDSYRADVCLHIQDRNGVGSGHVHLSCRARGVDHADRSAITASLIGDARRQMAWMPDANGAGRPLEFPGDITVSVVEQ